MRRALIALIVLAVLGLGVFAYVRITREAPEASAPITAPQPSHEVIGRSVEGRVIEAYRFPATGDRTTAHLLFVGGIHGGYEWNSVLLSYALIDHLAANPESVPANIEVTVIPSANPDGVFKVVGREGRFALLDVPKATQVAGFGRFNAHDVDLNRNFDCKWQPISMWRGQTVSAGKSAFSEPESKALRDFIAAHRPSAAIFFHSQANAVYASECEKGILPATMTLLNTYAKAAGYTAVSVFDAYEITGDAEGWLASIGIPAITVELSTHDKVEWEKNLAGIKALFARYGTGN